MSTCHPLSVCIKSKMRIIRMGLKVMHVETRKFLLYYIELLLYFVCLYLKLLIVFLYFISFFFFGIGLVGCGCLIY